MIILTHTTSLHSLRHLGAQAIADLPRLSLRDLTDDFDGATDAIARYLAFVASIGAKPAALHLLFSRGSRLPKSDFIMSHTFSDASAKAFVKLADGVFAACPELVVCQLASWSEVNDLTHLLYELCGTYTHPANEHIFITDRKSFTTKSKIRSFCAQRNAFPHASKVMKALDLVHERSASPMETAFAMLLGFPCRLGGLAFPPFEMNGVVEVPKRLRRSTGREHLVVDLCWAKQKVAFEYDSAAFHGTVSQVAKDTSKRNLLIGMGFTVVSFSGGQVGSQAEVRRAADALMKALNHRPNPRCKDFEGLRMRLEWAVFEDKGAVFDGNPHISTKHLHPTKTLDSLSF
ncbi:MAG: DUF559 domain-containing protein [Eggerthellaceae bacterium]|nr:DUF559 domain-containing protein [Eggerthellaceae bacterium]